ncbi:uncharacterized protein E5676_scaffold16G003210 [Cucumis melo var. makuwa]|uniref:Uncharacterized protein n=1 Tax=Cucumis melo var. makuwa TaxID=1194695 RepID=A0A5D3CID8_CUCMM|nr:uncharacterized protein E5676_scaffold16G003210 [Cucumis melo var. makuwa]
MKNVKNLFKNEDSEVFEGLDFKEVGEIFKKEYLKCKKEEDRFKIIKNSLQESKITTKNLKNGALLMMNLKKWQLRFDIKDKVKLQPFLTLSDAITYAESVKEINELSSRKNRRKGPWNVNTSNKATAAHSSLTQSTKEQKKDKTSDPNGKKIQVIPKRRVSKA